jgi:hypothetical protein
MKMRRRDEKRKKRIRKMKKVLEEKMKAVIMISESVECGSVKGVGQM